MFGGVSVFQGSGQYFTSGQILEIWGNFSKICIKINKNVKNYRENVTTNAKFSRKFLFFTGAAIFPELGVKSTFSKICVKCTIFHALFRSVLAIFF